MSIETKKIEDIKEFKEIIGNNQRIMGLDVGSKRIGISISDPELKIAISLKTINRDKSIKLFNDLNNVVQKFKIGGNSNSNNNS